MVRSKAPTSRELTSLKDELRYLRRQAEELEKQVVRNKVEQEGKKLRIVQEKKSYTGRDLHTAKKEPSHHTETPKYIAENNTSRKSVKRYKIKNNRIELRS